MNSRIMILLAIFLIIGASIAGYLGYRTTQDAKTATAEAQRQIVVAKKMADAGIAGKVPVVVARQNIPIYKKLTADDLTLDYMKIAPPRTYSRIEDALGQPVQVSVQLGELLETGMLQPGSDIARLLHPGERAVAIPIDEVVGGGGFVQPGDMVDILLFLRGEAGGRDSAQIVMQSLRVIGFGSEIISVAGGTETPEQKNLHNADRAHARTAVLAVAEADVTRLMLASSLGTLRLAIRPPAELLVQAPVSASTPAAAGAKPGAPAAGQPGITAAGKALAQHAIVTDVPTQTRMLTSSALQPAGSAARAPAAASGAPVAARAARPSRSTESGVVVFRGLNSQGAQ